MRHTKIISSRFVVREKRRLGQQVAFATNTKIAAGSKVQAPTMVDVERDLDVAWLP